MTNLTWRAFLLRAGVAAAGLALAGGYARAAEMILPLDQSTVVGANAEAVCTGVGEGKRDNPTRWSAFPLKVVVVGKGGQFLAGQHVTLTQQGAVVAAVSCNGPWVMLRVPPGKYEVQAMLDGKAVKTHTTVPAQGQKEAVLRFPEMGGPVATAPPTPDEVAAAPQPPAITKVGPTYSMQPLPATPDSARGAPMPSP